MKRNKTLFLLLTAFCALFPVLLYSQVDTAWVRRYNGPGNGSDVALALAVDNSGNVYVTGRSPGSGTSYDYATIKYNSNGDTAWLRRYNGPGNSTDYGNAIAVDNSGNVYVTGYSTGSGTDVDIATIKYNSSGDTVWIRRYNGPGNGLDAAYDITVDNSGNIYVTGRSAGSGSGLDYATIKYNSSGDTVWVRRYDGNGVDWAYSIAVDNSGYVYVTGISDGDYKTIKYNSSGDTVWLTSYNGPGNGSDYALAIAIDNSNNVYISGYSAGSGTGYDYATIKYYQHQYPNDVGCAKIVAPTGIIDSGTVVTPACSVYNYGTVTQSYSVRMKIGASYNNTATVTNHLPGTYQYLTYPNWTANNTGTFAVSCSTELTGDSFPVNDKKTTTVLVRVLDVGVTQIIAPTGTIDSTGPIIPQGQVKNYGTNTETFNVTFRIGTSYTQTRSKTLSSGIEDTVNFPAWYPVRGTYATRCSTYLAGDVNHNNDTLSGSVTVQVQDIGVTQINTPSGTIDTISPIIPQARAKNFGTNTRSFFVTFKIGAVYSQTRTKTLDAGIEDTVNFPAWNPVRGNYTTRCSTYMVGDAKHNNDTLSGAVTVQVRDVGAAEILAPVGNIISGTTITPRARVENYGTTTETFPVHCRFISATDTIYYDDTLVTVEASRDSVIEFNLWSAIAGSYNTVVRVELAGDNNPENDTALNSFIVTEAGWLRVADISTAPSGKKPKGGSCMAGLNDKIYFLKASNTKDFNIYTPDAGLGTWTSDSMPLGSKEAGDGKNPKKGAAIAGSGNSLFMLRGNNTPGFWAYKTFPTESIGWHKLANITTGAKNPKDASGLVGVNINGTDYIFAMKGSKTDEFYLYNILTNTWTPTPTKPTAGTSGKVGYKKGSCLCYDGDSLVYVMKGNYGDLFRYNLITNIWTELKRYNYKLFINRDGKRKKIGEGSGLVYCNNNIYFIKGGNTDEFWRYDIAKDTFVQMGPATDWDIPTGSGKRVKGGGCITMLGNNFYVAKGSNTPEFYRHGLPLSDFLTLPKSTGEGTASKTVTTNSFNLTIVPNPVIKVATVRYTLPVAASVTINLFNVIGGLIKSQTNSNPTKSGLFMINDLPAGIYILRIIMNKNELTKKVVIEK